MLNYVQHGRRNDNNALFPGNVTLTYNLNLTLPNPNLTLKVRHVSIRRHKLNLGTIIVNVIFLSKDTNLTYI